MNIAVGFGCLVAVAVLGGVTGLPEQHLEMEDHPAEQQLKMEDPAEDPEGSPDNINERSWIECQNKRACDVVGGKCIEFDAIPCDGCLRRGKMWCKNHRSCGCCIPNGCTFGSTTYKNGVFLNTSRWDYCAEAVCNEGNWDLISSDCVPNNVTCQCDYNPVYGGCILGLPKLPHLACNCTLHSDTLPSPTCSGQIVECIDPISYFCTTPGAEEGHCLQGGGNCMY